MNEELPFSSGIDPFRFPHSDALLRNILEYAAVGMVLVAPDTRVVYANRAYTEMLGYGPGECVGMPYAALLHADELAVAVAQAESLRRGEMETYRAERRYLRKDGRAMWGAVAASILRDEAGRPMYLLVQMTDIDHEKRTEAALALSESRWNSALESAGQGVWDADLRAGSVFYSRTWHTMRGFAPDEYVDSAIEAWLTRVHPDDRDRIRDLVVRQNLGEIPRNAFDYRERHRDGHYIWILSRGGPVEWDAAGQPVRFVGTDTDISSLKAVEGALAGEKEKLRVTLQSIGDGVISADAQGRVTFMNPTAEEMTGWKYDQALGRAVADVFVLVNEATGAGMPDPVAQTLLRQELYHPNAEAMLVSRNGDERALRVSASPVRAPQGDLLGVVLVFQDVTHARTLQKQLAHSAMHDTLTGLPNRAAFERALNGAVEQTHQEQREHALCFVDLDHFKIVNDTAGHAAGDAVLKQIAHAIRRACRSQDFTARIGGDEFALIFADCPIAGARKAAQQVIDSISGVHFTWNGATYDIGASIGITAITPGAPHVTELMAQADAACYSAKNAGRNRVVIYDPRRHGPERLQEIA